MTSEPQWIVVPRWDDFQHPDAARSGVPPWLKTYTRLLSDDAYLGLTGHERAVLHGLWLAYGSSRAQLHLDPRSLSYRLQLRVTLATLERLNHAGFIEFSASRPASNNASRPASPEKRREEKALPTGPYDPRARPPAKTGEARVCPLCTLACRNEKDLRDHLDNVHWLEGDQLEHALTAATP